MERTRFAHLMESEGRKFSWLAEQTGIDAARLSRWAAGIGYPPGDDNRQKLADALGRDDLPRDFFTPTSSPSGEQRTAA